MATDISLFDYHLPEGFIAQSPAEPRESGRLMHISKKDDTLNHLRIKDFPSLLHPSDVLVVNNTRVFKARLLGVCDDQKQSRVELFLIRPIHDSVWQAIGKPWKRFAVGTTVSISPDFAATVRSKETNGTLNMSFGKTAQDVIRLADTFGSIPLPPYIKHPTHPESYQTSYAKIVGSVAAPTAGFHLTPDLLEIIKKKGVTICEITLHVGLGTFKPVKSQTIEEHVMHSEWVSVSEKTAKMITEAKKENRRIIAIGTTSVRTLEGVAAIHNGNLQEYEGDVNIFITPGFHFNIVDGMLTNFHLPKSTLIILVSAFAGRIKVLRAYAEAIRKKYRFYSFGDAMFIA
jgi:S-adenosylmethionine:tRNA ribosyltransferase-isomerase